MKLAYEKVDGAVRVWRCFAYGNEAEIPEQIDGCPVTELAPYTFSAHMDEEKLKKGMEEGNIRLWEAQETSGAGETPVLKGMDLKAVYLPSTLKKIGAYAFYNCNALEQIYFHGNLRDLGAGLFTGCHHIRHLDVTLPEDGVSCLPDILMEVPEKVQVVFHGKADAWLIFPEFFEEGTENTPARILCSVMHGSGMNYRNCFYQKRFDFRAYDSKFYWATVSEDLDTVLDMVQQRLRFPAELSADARETYEKWLVEHLGEAAEKLVQRRDMSGVAWLTENYVLKQANAREVLHRMTEAAGGLGFTEGAGYLLDVTHQYFKPKAKKFEL